MIDALGGIVKKLLGVSEMELQWWTAALQQALQPNGQVPPPSLFIFLFCLYFLFFIFMHATYFIFLLGVFFIFYFFYLFFFAVKSIPGRFHPNSPLGVG